MLLVRYLLGSRSAILDVASTPRAIVPALLFVLSAGFAREYDGEDILRVPWHFVRPLGASLVTASVLFLIVHVPESQYSESRRGTPPRSVGAYLRFLTLFWWTAPLAWLYAIPYERMLGSVEAMRVNLDTLALVALWRVVLMTRIVHVVYGIGYRHAFVLVMIFADLVALFIVNFVPGPVMSLMGGLRYSEQDELLASARGSLTLLAYLGAPALVLFWMITTYRAHTRLMEPRDPVSMKAPIRLGLAALLVWIPILPFTQAEQRRRTRAEDLIHAGHLDEALRFLSAHEPGDFPPHWDPPPRTGFHPLEPSEAKIEAALRTMQPAAWVRELFRIKLERLRIPENEWRRRRRTGP